MSDTETNDGPDEQDTRCSECGNTVDPGERFCTDCGTAVGESQTDGGDDRPRTDGPGTAGESDDRATGSDETIDKETIVGYLFRGAVSLLALLVVVTLYGFYTSTLRFINVWITEEYEPLVLAAFNLVVLLAGLIGLSLLVRRLGDAGTGSEPEEA